MADDVSKAPGPYRGEAFRVACAVREVLEAGRSVVAAAGVVEAALAGAADADRDLKRCVYNVLRQVAALARPPADSAEAVRRARGGLEDALAEVRDLLSVNLDACARAGWGRE